jgi:hypothetical protein
MRATIVYTGMMRNRIDDVLASKIESMIRESLLSFPELAGIELKVGLTKSYLGTATRGDNKINLNPRNLSYNTIGHELMHLVQGVGDIPQGEKSCDVFTIARGSLFLDRPPTYIRIPKRIKDNWEKYRGEIHRLCVESLELRKKRKKYMVWLERQIKKIK